MRKKLLSLALVLCMALSLLPTMALAEGDDPSPPPPTVMVGGVEMYSDVDTTTYYKNGDMTTTEPEDWTAKYDSSTGTLTLNNFSYSGEGSIVSGNAAVMAAILANYNLNNIELEGTNTITMVSGVSAPLVSCAINTPGALNISGTGSLTVAGGKAERSESSEDNDKSVSCGIAGNVTISSGSVTVVGGEAQESYGIYGRTTVSDGLLVAKGETNAINNAPTLNDSVKYVSDENSSYYESSTIEEDDFEKYLEIVPYSSTPTDPTIWVGFEPVTDNNRSGNGWSYADSELILDNFSRSTGYTFYFGMAGSAVIRASGDLNIVLAEDSDNFVTGSDLESGSGSSRSYGIYTDGMLSISGDGSLTSTGGSTEKSFGGSYGIYGGYKIPYESPSPDVSIFGNVTVNAIGGNAPEDSGSSYGIYGSTIVYENAKVVATGTEAGDESCGIYGEVTVSDNATVTATGDTVGTGIYNDSYGIHGIAVVSDNAAVTAIGGTAKNGKSYGIYNDISMTPVSITGGIINAIGGEAGTRSCGIYNGYSKTPVNITGGRVAATGGKATGELSGSYGIFSYDIDIIGGYVTATGGESKGDSYGIYNGKCINISGSAIVNAISGEAVEESSGIYSSNDIGMSGGKVVAVSGGGANSYGVSIYDDSNINYTRGLLVAKGKTSAATKSVTGIEALTGVTVNGDDSTTTIDKFAVWGESGKYTVIEDALDLTSEGHEGKTTDIDGYSWSENTLTLKNVIVNGPDNSDGDAYGIKLPDGATIVLEGTSVVSAGDSTDDSSFGVYSSGDIRMEGGNVIAIGGSETTMSYGIYGQTISLSGGSGTALGGKQAMNAEPTLDNDSVIISGEYTDKGAVWSVPPVKSATPETSTPTVKKTAATQASVKFSLSNDPAYENGQLWTVYETATGATLAADVTVSNIGNTITMTHSKNISADTYYVSVIEDGKTESDRLELTVGAYVPSGPSGSGNSSSGGGSSEPSYTITNDASEAENGSITFSKTYARQGETVKVTPKADEGYELDTLTVKDVNGSEILVTKNADGTYSFKMPYGKVTVNATFKAAQKLWVNPFTDVAQGDWFYEAVRFTNQNGLFEGTSKAVFSPNVPMTRAMLWTVLGRLDGQTLSGSSVFDDAKAWATARGITDGSNPNGNITREQLVTILWRYAGSPEANTDLSKFSDAENVAYYATAAMAWAVETGIVTGADGKLMPQDNATRAQVAAILMRYSENIK